MILADIWSCIRALSTDKSKKNRFFHLSMEINESPVVFQDVISKYKTARDFTEACAYCLIPLAPRYNNRSLLLCEECEEKWREEKRPAVQDSGDPETPLSSANISLTLADADDTENCALEQLDKKSELERLFLRVEKELTKEDLSRGMLNTNESRSRSRIIEIVKRVLKTCGYVVTAVIGVPLIAGKLNSCISFQVNLSSFLNFLIFVESDNLVQDTES